MAVRFMLDTNACIYLMGRKPRYERLSAKVAALPAEDIALSSVVIAELRYGVAKSAYRTVNAAALEEFVVPFVTLPFDDQAAECYGAMRADLERAGVSIGPMDTLIAAHALSLNATLVTNNTREFTRVRGLHVENWLLS